MCGFHAVTQAVGCSQIFPRRVVSPKSTSPTGSPIESVGSRQISRLPSSQGRQSSTSMGIGRVPSNHSSSGHRSRHSQESESNMPHHRNRHVIGKGSPLSAIRECLPTLPSQHAQSYLPRPTVLASTRASRMTSAWSRRGRSIRVLSAIRPPHAHWGGRGVHLQPPPRRVLC